MEKFTHVGSISKDHIDPSVFCILTAKSKQPEIPLADFLVFSPRWDVASGTFRPPVSFVVQLVSCRVRKKKRRLIKFSWDDNACSITTETPRPSLWD